MFGDRHEEASQEQQHPDSVAAAAAAHVQKPVHRGQQQQQEQQQLVMVDVMVKFSRAMFAQLLLTPPANPPLGYPLPFPSDRDFRAASLGLKIAVGFELLCNKASDREKEKREARGAGKIGGVHGEKEAVTSFLTWEDFEVLLATGGYFCNLERGSKAHRKVLVAAVERFERVEAYVRRW